MQGVLITLMNQNLKLSKLLNSKISDTGSKSSAPKMPYIGLTSQLTIRSSGSRKQKKKLKSKKSTVGDPKSNNKNPFFTNSIITLGVKPYGDHLSDTNSSASLASNRTPRDSTAADKGKQRRDS